MLEFASELQPTKRILEIKCWSSQAHSNLRNEFWRLNVFVRKRTPNAYFRSKLILRRP